MPATTIQPSQATDPVSQLAYHLFEVNGSIPGREFQHWTTAESIFRLERDHPTLLSITFHNGTLWIRITPPELMKMDETSIDPIEQAIVRVIDLLPQPRIVIDLTPVRYLASTMIAMLACLNQRARIRGGRLSVVHTTRQLHEEMYPYGQDHVMEVSD